MGEAVRVAKPAKFAYQDIRFRERDDRYPVENVNICWYNLDIKSYYVNIGTI